MKRANRALGLVALLLLFHGLFLLFRRALESNPNRATTGAVDDPSDNTPAPNHDGSAFEEESDSTTAISDSNQSRINSTLCQYNECLKGRWVPRDPPFESLEDFQKVFAARGSTKWSKCNIADPPKGVTRTPEEKERLEQQRVVDIMNWVWQPARGEQVPWDADDLVVRLLKTPGGLVIMGGALC